MIQLDENGLSVGGGIDPRDLEQNMTQRGLYPLRVEPVRYAIGSTVYLKSGSPPLTLAGYRSTGHELVADVEWFAGTEVRRDTFLAECISSNPV